jgi:phosphohistidine phosphatase
MDLILLRHGKAENSNPAGDFGRELVDRGRDQARRAARVLRVAEALPEIVLTSPLTRARQTADEFCLEAGIPGPVIHGGLACGMAPETAMGELAAFHDFRRVMLVGHEPDFSGFAQWILGTAGGAVEMKKGGLAGFRIAPPSRFGLLRYLIPPKVTGDDADEA